MKWFRALRRRFQQRTDAHPMTSYELWKLSTLGPHRVAEPDYGWPDENV